MVNIISKNQKTDRISYLASQILQHQKLYYNASPEITDAEYDALFDELNSLDPNHPAVLIVGQDSSKDFEKIKHIIPMNSQAKATQPTEFKKWAVKMGYNTFIIQYKLDGISVELQYIGGHLKRAVSRGDGMIGDNITSNVLNMEGVPKKIDNNFSGAIRGEILMFHDVFNRKYSEQKNCRNTASGIAKRKDGKGTEDLTIISYDALSLQTPFSDEFSKLDWMQKNKFNVVKVWQMNSTEDIINLRDFLNPDQRKKLEFDIDGLVVKGLEIDWEDMKRYKPMKQIAFKFPPEEYISTLLDVEWSQSGNTFTPVAIIEPVELAGTTVQRASLANPDLISELKLFIGSRIVVAKRGEIIPKIERVVDTPSNATSIELPTECPTCKSNLHNIGTRLYCPNELCPAKELHRLRKWITTLDVKNFGEKLLEALYSRGKIRLIADLYDLTKKDITSIPRQGSRSAEKALENLYAVNKISLAKFIGGFDIEGVGETLMEPIIKAGFDTLEKIRDSSVDDLIIIDRYGEKNSLWILEGIRSMYTQMILVLDKGKIKIQNKQISNMAQFSGLSFCFTGKLNTISRNEAKEIVTSNGGGFKSSVTKGLSYLVTNTPESGSSKNIKAREFGTEIITESQFLELIKN